MTLIYKLALLLLLSYDGSCSLLTKELVKKLFHGDDPYDRHIRPVINESTPTDIKMLLFVSQILDMDERLQQLKTNVWLTYEWYDEFLRWDPAEYSGLTSFKLTSDLVWMPDIVIYNNAADAYKPYMFNKIVKVEHDGHINWASPCIIQSSCQLDVANFPFDYQKCPIKFGPWQHDGSELMLSGSGDGTVFRSDGEWDMIGLNYETSLMSYPDSPEAQYYDVTYTIHIRRRSMYYVFNLLVPCILIASITLLGFLLPVDSGEKVSLGITVLLSLTVFLLLIAESMPPSSVVPIIGHYYVSTMVLVSISILLTVSVINLHHRGPYCKRAPMWIRRIILGNLAKNLRLQPDDFKNEFHPQKRGFHANGHLSSFQRTSFRRRTLEERGKYQSENSQVKPPGDGTIQNGGRQDNASNLLLLRQMNDHMRYIRFHFEDDDNTEDIKNEWKQIALVIDRLFAIFYVLGSIGTVMILVFKIVD
nr:neuronal acetylcholine receptor subunit alpha-10-like [Lytechinus pictus]